MNRAVITVLVILAAAAVGVALFVRRRRAGRRVYAERLDEAVADGILTPDEIAELNALREKHEITGAHARMAALAAYRRVLRDAVADHELTPDEDATLERLQAQLGVRAADIRADLTQLSRLRLLARVTRGDLPVVPAAGFALAPGEQSHWIVRATHADRLSVPRPGRTSLRASEFIVDAPEPFSASGERDAIKPREDILPRDPGVLVVTSRRIVFQGARRTLTLPHARVQRVALFQDGVRIDEAPGAAESAAEARSRFFLVDDAELTAAFVLQAARLRRDQIRPATRPNRSA